MGHKYLVKNISKVPVFLAEAGRLLQPGGETTAGRLDQTTRNDPRLSVQEGDFDLSVIGKVTTEKQRYEDEDEDELEAPKAKAVETGPAKLSDVKHQSKVVPLTAEPTRASSAADEAPDDDDDKPLSKDELDDEIPTASKPEDKGEDDDKDEEPAGFVTRTTGPTDTIGR